MNPPITQAVSLARRMAGKKGQVVQLQTEVNNEEDWEKLLTREGLIVVDIYSDWCGPCVGMIGNLKKVKLEIGGDILHLAIAKSDEIEALKRFRNKSEPTWMFIGGGQLVNVMFGANAPKLMRLIESEFKQEQKVMRGETWRRAVPFDELCEEEKERYEAAEKIRKEAEAAEAKKQAAELEAKRTRIYTGMAQNLLYETLVICFPHTIDLEGCAMLQQLDPIWQACGIYIAVQQRMFITKEMCEEVFYRGAMEVSEDLLENLSIGSAIVLWLKCQVVPAPGAEGERELGDIEKLICEAVNKVTLEKGQEHVIPDPNSVPGQNRWKKKPKVEEAEDGEEEEPPPLIDTLIPGCWTPASYFTKSAACRFLFPTRAEKVMVPEEPPPPPKIVLVYEATKDKECFDLVEEYEEDVLNIGYFNSGDPNEAKQICATPKQYSKILPFDCHRLVVVVAKKKSEPLLTFAAVGALYVSPDEKAGEEDANKFFPPGVEPVFYLPESIEEMPVEEKEIPPTPVEETKEEEVEQNDDDLMASLGMSPDAM